MSKKAAAILVAVAVAPAIPLALLGPISQPQDYYAFADSRRLLGVDNFWNVVTGLPFLLVGATGIYLDRRGRLVHDNPPGFAVYRWFFAGVLLIAPGSAWFHWRPDNASLVWDRLPMSLAFMALTTGVLADFLGARWARRLLYPLLLSGAASVIYWYLTERAGRGDLRLYLLVQFLPMLLLPLVMLIGHSRFSRSLDLAWALGFYVLAKVAECYDRALFELPGGFSGHSLKHLLAAVACILLLGMLARRRPVCSRGGAPDR